MSAHELVGDPIGEVGALLTPRFAFGISAAFQQCITFLGSRRLLYSVGRHLVVRDACVGQEVQFVASEEHTLRITGVAVSSNKKYVACIEQSSTCSPGQVSVYSVQHLKRVKTLPVEKAAAKSKDNAVIDISFSASAKLLVVQKGAPEWDIQVWRWYSGKLVASGKADQEVTQLECSPWEELQLTIIGRSHARALRIDTELEQVKITSLMNEPDALLKGLLYLPGGLLALAVEGDAVNVYTPGFKLEQQLCKWDAADPPAALTRKGRGLIVSTNSGVLQLWDTADRGDKTRTNQPLFQCSRKLVAPLGQQHKVLGLAASDGEEEIAVVGSGGQLMLLHMEELAAEEEQPIRSLLMPQDPDLGSWKLVGGGFHEGGVVALDAAVQQPWVVSAGEDKTVRIWNWPKRTCMSSAMMPDDIVSCAIHPSGVMVLIGMVNKLRLAYVLNGDLETIAELPIKKALAVKFSHGGHLFAAAGRTNHVEVFSTYTQQRLSPGTGMKGHVSTVTALNFAASDRWLVSAGAGGAVYFWDLTTYARVVELEHVDKKCIYHGAVFYNKSPGAVVRTYDGRIQQITAGSLQYELQPGGSEYAPIMLVGEDRILLVASTTGVVTAMGWPHEFPLQPGCTLDHRPQPARLHGASITAMAYLPTSGLSGLLFTAGADGVILVSQASLVLDARAEDVADDSCTGGSLLLCRGAEIEAMKDRIRDLALQFTHIKSAAEYQTMRRESELKEQIQGLESQLSSLTVMLDQKAAELEATRIAAMEHEEAVVRELELAHSRLAEEVEALWEQRLQLERMTMSAQDAQAADTLLQAQEKLQRQHTNHQKELAQMKADWSADVAVEKSRLAALASAKAEQEEFFEEMVTQTEQDFEAHATVMERRQEAWAAATEEERMRMKADNHLLKKTSIRLKGQKAQDVKRIELLSNENVEMRTTLQDRELTIKKLNAEIEERDAVISSNYHTIQQIRRRMQDLEKHKFVLGYKADLYQKELHPKQEAVRKLEGELEEHDKQLVAGLTAMRDLQAEVQEKDGYIKSLKHEILDAKSRLAEQSIMLNSFSTDLFQAMQEPDDRTPTGKSRRQEALQVLYNKYCFNASRKSGPSNVEAELQRHMQLLEMKGTLLERRVQLAQHQGQSAVQQKEHQNSMLLQDMAELVQYNHKLTTQLNEVQAEYSAVQQRYRLVQKYIESQSKDNSNATLSALLKELQSIKVEGDRSLCTEHEIPMRDCRPPARPQSAGPRTAPFAKAARNRHSSGLLMPNSSQLLVAHEQQRLRELNGRLVSGSSSSMQARLRATTSGGMQPAVPARDV